MTWKVELGNGKVKVMRIEIYVDKLLRVSCQAREEILAPLTGNIIGEGDPVDEITFS